MRKPTAELDRSVPVLIAKIGHYPFHHGGLGAIRTLGRVGVPVYAITEDRFTPAATSRYLRDRFVWPTTGSEGIEQLVTGLLAVGRRLERRAVIVPTDEEAAALIAENAEELGEYFIFPRIAPGLPRALGSKRGLYELCRKHGIPAPASDFPSSADELVELSAKITFPVVVKNLEPWVRRRAPVVPSTTVVHSAAELLSLARTWGDAPSVIVQDYIPKDQAEDWIVHLYCDAESNCLVRFTGVKVRSWPPHAGMTSCAYIAPNPILAAMAERFCKEIGFQGIADLDWRFDRRDGQYKLVDFNPRVGAQFRLFETEAGIDVVRAMHLDLTGRQVPVSSQRNGRRMIVENVDGAARLAYRRSSYTTPPRPRRASGTELAWLAPDDPLPFLTMGARIVGPGVAHLVQRRRAARERRRGPRNE